MSLLDAICPRQFNLNHFSFTRKNVNQKNVTFICRHRRGKNCKAELHFKRDKNTGIVDFDNKIRLGQHTRQCCVVNRVDTEDYDYDGKPKANEQGDDMLSSEGSDEENVQTNVDNRSRPPDVSEDMRICVEKDNSIRQMNVTFFWLTFFLENEKWLRLNWRGQMASNKLIGN